MGSQNKIIEVIKYLIKNPKKISSIYHDNAFWEQKVISEYNTSSLPVIPINDIVNFPTAIDYMTFLDGGSLATDYVLLKSLAQSIPNCEYFEIGTWRGQSVSNVAEVASQCYSLNIPLDKMNQKSAQQVGYFSNKLENVHQLFGDSLSYDFAKLDKKFDLIFIDGDHQYDYVKNDTTKIFNHLVHDDTVVVWHDYGNSPEEVRFQVMKGILDGVPKELHKHLYHVSNTKCAIFSRKSFNTKKLVAPQDPTRFKITMDMIDC